jgi:GNAT superfamily N-acetyltransferase
VTTSRESRPFAAEDADEVLRLAAAWYTPEARWHVGDLAWHLAVTGGQRLGDHTDVWPDPTDPSAERLVAVSWWDRIAVDGEARVVLTFVGPTTLLPGIVEHTRAGLDPAIAAVDVVVLDVEHEVAATLQRLGFAPVEHAEFFVNLQRDLSGLRSGRAGLELTPGVTITRADEHPAAAWTALHRAVWPGSSLTTRDRVALMQRWPYDPAFDLVAVADDGTLLSYVVGWLAPGGTTGQFEPVGTLPQWRRRGLARAVGRQVLQAFRDAGAARALVYARGDDAWPAPRVVYASLGFTGHARQQRWQLRLRRARP